MNLNQKLELTWIGKEEEVKVEPRILLEDKEKYYGDLDTENMLIHGDNLLALKALEFKYTGKVKCIYIDPPYNTGSAFAQYDDNLEHSIWLSLMRKRIEILYQLLDEAGSIWISIDDDERDYLKILCDEIFGRKNFVASCIWHKKHTRSNDAKWFSDNHDYILVWAKNKKIWRPNLLPRTEESIKGYTNPDNDSRGVWSSGPCHVKTPSEKCIYPIITPSGREVWPPNGRSWMVTKERFEELVKDKRIWFGKDGSNVPRYKKFLTEVKDGFVPTTLWFRDEVGDNQEAKTEVKVINPYDVFTTPKPERLIERVLRIGSNEGDLVLDSFLGSGTTAAVAHKMRRKWIGIELGDHCYTHCMMRMQQVINGEQGGISKEVGWTGGGGFKFYELAPSLLKQDGYGNLIINTDIYTATMVAEAVAKYHGFTYSPDQEVCWKQGYSFEEDYIFTTDQPITIEYIDVLHSEMQPGESLLICCPAYQPGVEERYENINVQKIPQSILDKYDFEVESYSMNVNEIITPEVMTNEAILEELATGEVAATIDEEE